MKIRYRNSAVFMEAGQAEAWKDGELVNGNTSIQHDDGTYLSIQPDSTQQTRAAIGPWELCSLNTANNTVTFSGTGIAFLIPICGR